MTHSSRPDETLWILRLALVLFIAWLFSSYEAPGIFVDLWNCKSPGCPNSDRRCHMHAYEERIRMKSLSYWLQWKTHISFCRPMFSPFLFKAKFLLGLPCTVVQSIANKSQMYWALEKAQELMQRRRIWCQEVVRGSASSSRNICQGDDCTKRQKKQHGWAGDLWWHEYRERIGNE